jgi:hypothetical protein
MDPVVARSSSVCTQRTDYSCGRQEGFAKQYRHDRKTSFTWHETGHNSTGHGTRRNRWQRFSFFSWESYLAKKKKNQILACFNRQKYFAQAHQKQALAKEIKAAKFVEICHENHHELIELINDGMLVVLSKGGKRLKKDKCNLV